jgi:sialidase-1
MPLLLPSRPASLLIRFLPLFLIAGLVSMPAAVEQTVVYQSGTGGYNTYRIPAIVRTPNSDLLAFAEARKNSRSDTGDIDLILKRSHDGGQTWTAPAILWDDGGNTCGNPCAVVDEKTGVVWLLSTHNLGKDREDAINRSTGDGGRTVWVLHSEDNGATWSHPVQITSTVKKTDWKWYATGPGIGIQIKHGPHAGRLVIPCDNSHPDEKTDRTVHESHVIYSDDHGASWQLGGSAGPDMNECQVAELFDRQGTLLLDMRSLRGLGQRGESRSTDGGATWTEPVNVPTLVEPVCQASILRWEKAGAEAPGWLLFSNPADPVRNKRRNLTVRASTDNGASWSRALVLRKGPAAYSCLMALTDTAAGCLYEVSDERPYEQIVFARFTAADLAPH